MPPRKKRTPIETVRERIEHALAVRKHDLTPRQAHFLRLYSDPESTTFGNAYASAIEAGYAHSSAKVVHATLMERRRADILAVLDAAGVTDEALAGRHHDLLQSHEGRDVAAAIKLGYEVRGHIGRQTQMINLFLRQVGGTREDAERGIELLKRMPKDPHETARMCQRFLAQYRAWFPAEWRVLQGGEARAESGRDGEADGGEGVGEGAAADDEHRGNGDGR